MELFGQISFRSSGLPWCSGIVLRCYWWGSKVMRTKGEVLRVTSQSVARFLKTGFRTADFT
jgi:hypothetical protein